MTIRKKFLGLIVVASAVCSAHVERAEGATNSVPANYRQLVAKKILESVDRKNIQRARISSPHTQWMGLIYGNRPVVCVELFRQTPIMSGARDIWIFTFENGRIASAGYSNTECSKLSPFNGLVR